MLSFKVNYKWKKCIAQYKYEKTKHLICAQKNHKTIIVDDMMKNKQNIDIKSLTISSNQKLGEGRKKKKPPKKHQ